ncbi:MAG: acetyl-CoA C-acetyltransferase [Bacteroidia bacterium]|nr:acetyl-CoA C-acetyltransferase [Bacteroidia bacterium]
MREAFIYDAVRTPRGKGKKDGALYEVRPVELARTVLAAILERNKGLNPNLIEDVILGCVTQIGEQGANIAKTAAMIAGYPETVSGSTVNRFCASGLEAINQATACIQAGMAELIVAGGVESMSRVPMGSDGGAMYMDPRVALQNYFIPQGNAADLLATLNGYTRQMADEFALSSQQKAAKAIREGYFRKSIVPVKDVNGNVILEQDELVRPDTTLEMLASLQPSFEMQGKMAGFDAVALQRYPHLEKIEHIHHAGNSSGIADGAAAVLIGSSRVRDFFGLRPRAIISSFATIGTEPTVMLTGPALAAQKAVDRTRFSLDRIDLFEVNEAFASVVIHFMKETGITAEKINVNGGAIALGHPLGATGAMLICTLLDELERQDKHLGLATLCVGGGMGVATVIERL